MRLLYVFFLCFVIAAATAYATVKFTVPGSSTVIQLKAPPLATETAFERVTRTNTIRCGYYSWAPFMVKDPNTGAFSGVYYDLFNQIADNAGLKVEWTEEIGLGDFPAALKNGRIDAYCTPLGQLGTRARAVEFTDAFGYFPIYAFVKAGNNKFDGDLSKINADGVKISTMDGEITAILAAKNFPHAEAVQLPQNGTNADLLNNVVTGKADVVFTDYSTLNKFLENNPGTLVPVAGVGPVGVFGVGFPLPQGDANLRQMLNWSLHDMQLTGRVAALLEQYHVTSQMVLPPAKPYKE